MAAAMDTGEPEGSSPQPEEQVSWKRWAGRKDGDSGYSFGDITTGLLTQLKGHVREIKHSLGERALDVREKGEYTIAGAVETLLKESKESDQSEKVQDGSTPAGSSSQASFAERWWCQACQFAHKDHDRTQEPQTVPPHARGSLEVRLLAVGDPNAPIRRAGGEPAVEPICQLAVEGCLTGALRLDQEAAEDDDADPAVSEARFFFQEISGTDLRLHVWDKQSVKFTLGFEDKAFCGGAFIPLSAIVRHSSRVAADPLFCQTFEATIKAKLLPLSLIRARHKLETAERSGEKKPQFEHGHVLLGLKLQLHESPLQLRFALPAGETLLNAAAATGHVTDPMGTLTAAATAAGRTGKVANLEPWVEAVDAVRQDPLRMLLLQFWWAYTALRAPVWAWPPLLVCTLPPLAWYLRAAALKAQREETLYTDEGDDANKALTERVQQAVKGAAKVQQNILQLTEKVTVTVAKAEKVKYAMALGDPYTSAVWGLIVLVASFVAGIVLQLLLFVMECGLLRPLVWLVGSCLILPQSLREALGKGMEEAMEFQRRVFGDKLGKQLGALWMRLPDGMETSHLQLCERYAFEFVPQG